jgi:hypothetical protein
MNSKVTPIENRIEKIEKKITDYFFQLKKITQQIEECVIMGIDLQREIVELQDEKITLLKQEEEP